MAEEIDFEEIAKSLNSIYLKDRAEKFVRTLWKYLHRVEAFYKSFNESYEIDCIVDPDFSDWSYTIYIITKSKNVYIKTSIQKLFQEDVRGEKTDDIWLTTFVRNSMVLFGRAHEVRYTIKD